MYVHILTHLKRAVNFRHLYLFILKMAMVQQMRRSLEKGHITALINNRGSQESWNKNENSRTDAWHCEYGEPCSLLKSVSHS